MSFEIETGRPQTLTRKAEPDDIEEQIIALKQLKKNPALRARNLVTVKTESEINFRPVSAQNGKSRPAENLSGWRKKWRYILRKLFAR